MRKISKIAVLTSGGDAPGMNPCIRAVVRTAIYNGLEVVGVKQGYKGLIENDIHEMNRRSVSNILN
jgi:6-phosphofructokinase 1